MGWPTPQVEVLPRQEKGSVLVVGPEQERGASRWREDKARGVRLHRRVRALALIAACFKTEAASRLRKVKPYRASALTFFSCLLLSVPAELAASPPLLSVPLDAVEDFDKCARIFPPPSIRPALLFPPRKKKKKGLILFSCERPYLVSNGFSCYTPR